jgi:hypothetical protein
MNRQQERKLKRDMDKEVNKHIKRDFVPQTIGDVIALTIGFEYHKAKSMKEAHFAGMSMAKKILTALKEFKDGEED